MILRMEVLSLFVLGSCRVTSKGCAFPTNENGYEPGGRREKSLAGVVATTALCDRTVATRSAKPSFKERADRRTDRLQQTRSRIAPTPASKGGERLFMQRRSRPRSCGRFDSSNSRAERSKSSAVAGAR